MKRALIITYYWPPTGGSGVQRWVKFAKYLPQEGWQPVIYTPLNPEAITTDHTLEAEIPQEAEIIRREIFEPYNIYRALAGIGKGKKRKGQNTGTHRQSEVNPINSDKKSLSKRISLWIRGNFFIPDPRCMWIRPSVKLLKDYLKEHPVDVIISTGPPHSMHLIAEKVATATGIPWIADFRDPWTTMFYFKHLPLCRLAEKKHHNLEKRILDNATAVVAVSPLVKEEFESKTNTPVTLITNGFDESDFKVRQLRTWNFYVVHTGLFAADGNPDVLWEVLADKCREDEEFAYRLQIRLVGKTDREILDSIQKADLMKCTTNLGYKPHAVAVKEQQKASLLILPLRKEPEYKATIPGKLFEYIASRNPILGIGQSDGAMAQIINETGAGKVFGWDDKEAIRNYIDTCWKHFRDDTEMPAADNIERFSRRTLTREMSVLMNSITDSKDKNHKTDSNE